MGPAAKPRGIDIVDAANVVDDDVLVNCVATGVAIGSEALS